MDPFRWYLQLRLELWRSFANRDAERTVQHLEDVCTWPEQAPGPVSGRLCWEGWCCSALSIQVSAALTSMKNRDLSLCAFRAFFNHFLEL